MATGSTTRTPEAPAMPLGLRVVIGIDGTAGSLEAARQAEVLAVPHAWITLLGAWNPANTSSVAESRDRAAEAISRAQDALQEKMVATRVVCGSAAELLCKEAESQFATMIAVGAPGVGRLRGIVAGATVTALAHTSPCPLLIARPADAQFPRRVVVGVDGSVESAAAHDVASAIAERFGAKLRPIVAFGGAPVDRGLVRAIAGNNYVALRDDPVHALVDASTDADLVVVGSRGLGGLKALGSVSERVAHSSRSSVLLLRLPASGSAT